MALEIKRIIKTDGSIVTRVLSPGTIYQLFAHIKKTQRDHDEFQRTISKKLPDHLKEQARTNWIRRSQYAQLIQD